MSKIFDELKQNGWPIETREQLVFLYHYLNDEKKFWVAVGDMGCMDADMIQQIIKCITHDMPYSPLIEGNLDSLQMNELRRFLEDTCCTPNSPYFEMAKEISSLELSKDLIYEFRRFCKCNKPLTYEQCRELLDFVRLDVCMSWLVLASMYEVYMKFDFLTMMKFANVWIEKAVINDTKYHHFSPTIASDMFEAAFVFKEGD